MAAQSAGGEQWGLLTSLILQKKKDVDLSISPKASLPSWQIGVGFKSQSPFLFFKKHHVQEQKETIKVK